jgi:tether containing UBX domain for GLUT4
MSAILPDDFFTPTTAEIMATQAQLSARKEALNNAPLQVRSQREAEAKTKRDRWPEVFKFIIVRSSSYWGISVQTKIRIKFVDGIQLEKVFPSTDKIKAVYAFVRSCLREDVRPIKFILCMIFFLRTLFNLTLTSQTNPRNVTSRYLISKSEISRWQSFS